MNNASERMIIKGNGEYYFYDYPEPDERSDGIGYVDSEFDRVGCHECNRSAIWDDMTGYIDEIQNENDLQDIPYLVTYFYADDGLGLLQMAEFVSKQQIIDNVIAQKYREGADYYPASALKAY